jgi:hypothetical protein
MGRLAEWMKTSIERCVIVDGTAEEPAKLIVGRFGIIGDNSADLGA